MPNERPISRQGLRVLKAFLTLFTEDPAAELTGTDVMKVARLASGTVYPLLLGFEERGVLRSRWEEQRPEDLQRPRKRLYKLTARGAAYARRELDQAVREFTVARPQEA